MIDDGGDDEVASSLARLRMFLAPHQPGKSASGDLDHQPSSTIHADLVDSKSEQSTIGDDIGQAEYADNPDDLSGDISTLAEQLSSADDDQLVHLEVEASEIELTIDNSHPESDVPEAVPAPPDGPDTSLPPGPPTTAVATVSPISSLSKEYTRVRYLLQCSLPRFSIHDDMVMWDMKNPALVTQYEAHASGLLELDSWVEVDQLSAAMNDKHSDETASPDESSNAIKKFTTGTIPVDLSASTKGRKQLVLCKIAVGRSITIDSEADAKTTELPSEYHSYYLHPHAGAVDNSIASEQRYRHEYILRDALQILPQYLVRFSYSAVGAKVSHACALCELHAATLFCKACDAELCAECDNQVHSANKLVERHKRTPLREQILGSLSTTGRSSRRSSTDILESKQGSDHVGLAYGQAYEEQVHTVVSKRVEESMADFHATCRVHEGKKIEFYCPLCATPVCVNCKMVGDHSTGDKGTHRLLPINDAYAQCLHESFKNDPLVDSRRSVIESKLALISQWEKDIERNREHVEAAIRQQYEQALASLDTEVKKKTSVLKGEALEFLRQRQQIDWLDSCLEAHRSSCSVVEFLSTWNQHKLLRAEQRDSPVASHMPLGGDQVKADVKLVGSLQVVAADQAIPRLSFSGSDFGDVGYPDDRCGPLSPRGSIGSVTSPPASVRRQSDTGVRRKLLSMRSVEKRSQEGHISTASPSKTLAGIGTLSPEGRKMMDEIRNDLFARRTVRSSAGSLSPSMVSPLRSPTLPTTLRTLSIQPGMLGMHAISTISAPAKQHTGTAAWTALLRHELAASKENATSR